MNACNNLPLYLYGELDARDKKLFEEHLNSCKECAQAIETFEEVKENKKVYDVPAGFINSVFEKTTRKPPLFIFSKSFKMAFALAACILVLVLAAPRKQEVSVDNHFYYDEGSSIEEIMDINFELDDFDSDFMIYS